MCLEKSISFFSGNLSDKIGRKNILVISSIGSVFAMSLFIYTDSIYFLGFVGLFLFASGPVLMASIQDTNTHMPTFMNSVYIYPHFSNSIFKPHSSFLTPHFPLSFFLSLLLFSPKKGTTKMCSRTSVWILETSNVLKSGMIAKVFSHRRRGFWTVLR